MVGRPPDELLLQQDPEPDAVQLQRFAGAHPGRGSLAYAWSPRQPCARGRQRIAFLRRDEHHQGRYQAAQRLPTDSCGLLSSTRHLFPACGGASHRRPALARSAEPPASSQSDCFPQPSVHCSPPAPSPAPSCPRCAVSRHDHTGIQPRTLSSVTPSTPSGWLRHMRAALPPGPPGSPHTGERCPMRSQPDLP